MIFADTLTGGTIAGTIIAVICALFCLGWIVFFLLQSEGWIATWGLGGLVVVALVWGFLMWPFAYEYHHWVDKQGTVTKISKRLVPAGDSGMQEKIVVQISGDPEVYGLTETRASLLEKGDRLHIRCKKAYEFGVNRGAHGWDCKWVSGSVGG